MRAELAGEVRFGHRLRLPFFEVAFEHAVRIGDLVVLE
jgi:hypothetical protein